MEPKKERLEDWAENRKEHMKDMPWKDRLKWYVTYYWIHTAIAILVISVSVYFIWFYTIGKKETWLSGAIINMTVDTACVDQVEEAFAGEQELNVKKQQVILDPFYSLDVDNEELTQNNIANLTKIEAYYANGDMDLIIAPEKTFDYLDTKEFSYQDLEEVLGTDIDVRFDEEHLRYMKRDDGTSFVCAVSLENTEFIRNLGMTDDTSAGEQIWISIPYTARHVENAAEFIEYIFE